MSHNPETGPDALHVEKELTIVVRNVRWTLRFELPHYINQALKAADLWPAIVGKVTRRAGELLEHAAQQGSYGDDARIVVGPVLCFHAKQVVNDDFGKLQHKAGNDAWAAPLSIAPDLSPLWMP